jgi:hypothetical protein
MRQRIAGAQIDERYRGHRRWHLPSDLRLAQRHKDAGIEARFEKTQRPSDRCHSI